jgi:nucleotide-binding universal stress UspA family protein
MITPMLDGAAPGVPGYVDRLLASIRESGRKILANAEATASKSVPNVHGDMVASAGQTVASAILRYAKRVRADLIVLGTHGRRGISRLVMGSDAEGVLREAGVPVLLVRSPERKSDARPSKSPKGRSRRRAVSAQAPVMPGL